MKLETLLVVYHRPFWRGPDGSLWEREGAFSRFLEALAPHFERILVAAPVAQKEPAGHRVAAENVRLLPLPFFDGLPGFFRVLPGALAALWRAIGQADLVNLRMPTPAGAWAYALSRLRGRPVFLLVVGDLAGVAESVPTDSLKRWLYHSYVQVEERLLRLMVRGSLTITNGRALYEKHAGPSPSTSSTPTGRGASAGRAKAIYQTRNSTVRLSDLARPRQEYWPPRARLLCVSRVDPRKGLRYLPAALAVLRERDLEPSLDVLGPTVGQLGEQEKAATLENARRLGLVESVRFHGAATIEQVYQAYTEHDLLVVPSLPGEGLPRVLLEAMAAGLPVVATRVSGIPDLVQDGQNGLLVPPGDGQALGEAAARLLQDETLRAACVAGGYTAARENTAEDQAAWLAKLVRSYFGAGPPTLTPSSTLGEGASSPPFLDRAGGQGVTSITIPLAGLNLSGGVRSLLLLANRLAERGENVRIIVPDYAADPPVTIDPRVGLDVLRTGGPGLLRKTTYYLRLASEAASGAKVVVANYYLTAYPTVASWLLRGRRAALAYNVRGYEPQSHGLMAPVSPPGRYLRFALAWLSYRLPLAKIVTTDWLKQMVGDRRAVVVGHGIDLEVFRPQGVALGPRALIFFASSEAESDSKERPPVVGVIGRHGAVKGYGDLLAAAALLPEDAKLRFLVARADPVPLPSARPVDVVEPRAESEMAAFYRRCDIFVFPSLAEGFGLPALEAMACGCAVVTTDCGGVSAFARPDENCLMVPPGRPALLAAAIERLLMDPELRARLAAAGLKTAPQFDQDASLDRLADAIVALEKRA